MSVYNVYSGMYVLRIDISIVTTGVSVCVRNNIRGGVVIKERKFKAKDMIHVAVTCLSLGNLYIPRR